MEMISTKGFVGESRWWSFCLRDVMCIWLPNFLRALQLDLHCLLLAVESVVLRYCDFEAGP